MASPWDVEASNSGGGNSELVPAGNHLGILVGLIDLGTHEETYQNEKYDSRKALLAWELAGDRKSDGTPFVITADYTLAPKISGKSKLRQLLEGWRGKAMGDGEKLDLAVLLGKPCLINVGHKQSKKNSTYAVILGVSPVMRGMTVPAPTLTPFAFHISSGEDFVAPDWLPYLYGKPVEEHIRTSHEINGRPSAAPVANGRLVPVGAGMGVADEDLPF